MPFFILLSSWNLTYCYKHIPQLDALLSGGAHPAGLMSRPMSPIAKSSRAARPISRTTSLRWGGLTPYRLGSQFGLHPREAPARGKRGHRPRAQTIRLTRPQTRSTPWQSVNLAA